MSDPEPDSIFRERLLRVVSKDDFDRAMRAKGRQLDALGRKYDVFRTGIPLPGFDGFKVDGSEEDDT